MRGRLGADGVTYAGLYGLEGGEREVADRESAVERVVGEVPNAWVELKGPALSVHYRQSPDPEAARRTLLEGLAPIATSTGRRVVEGKLTVELVPDGVPLKAGAVRRFIAEHRLRAALYAGDDLADLEAFEALEQLGAEGLDVVRVAVRGAETPTVLLDAAELIVGGPEELVQLLGELVP